MDVRSFGRVKIIIGKKNGKYPYGNSIFIDDDVTALIDPSLMIRECLQRATDAQGRYAL